MNPEELFEAISDLMQARSEEQLGHVLNKHPELLGEEVDGLLQQLADTARQDGDANAGNLFGQIRELLQTVRASRESPGDESELSSILQELSRPAQLGDMPGRINLCQRALELVSPENAPLWATLQCELGNVLAESLLGDRADSIEQAIQHYNEALKVRTEKDFPEEWAATQNNLAIAYNNRIRGDRADNLEQAIQHYNEALKVRTEKDFPKDWAMTKNNLAAAYWSRIRGDRADNIEQAIQHYNEALKVRTEKDFPEEWAATQNNLGLVYGDRIRGDRADNIEQAIQHYNEALKVRTEKDFPADWAMTKNNLANAYGDRIRGNRADNIEQAIQHYNSALKVYTEKDFPEDWAMTQNNLGLVYGFRIRGDRADNIEQAIEHCNLALKVRTEKDFPKDWAMTQNSLADAYEGRIQGVRADNIEQAIQHYNEALKIKTEKDFPKDWAMTQNNLAAAYWSRIRGDRADNLEQAIEHYQLALKIRTEKDFPEDWAMTKSNLAAAYSDRIRGDRAYSIEQAIEHYSLALKVYTEKDFPEKWAATQNNLAIAYNNRIRGDRADNIEQAIEQAIEHYSLALKVYTPKDFPGRCRGTAYNLGNLCLEGQRFSPAGKAYSIGMEAAEELYIASIFQTSREAELAETRDLYRRAGYALSCSGEAMKAVEALERGRARGLGDALARDRADLERVQEVDSQAYRLYMKAVQELQSLESKERTGYAGEEKVLPERDLMMQARARLYGAVDRIRRIPGYESFLKEPGWEEIATAVVEGQPLVYIAAAPGGSAALIVQRSAGDASVEAVPLDGFSEERLQEILKIWFEAYEGWQEALFDVSFDYGQAEEKWFDAIGSITSCLWRDVIGPVYGALKPLKPEQVFLIPTGLLSLLPLHAAWRDEGGKRQYFQDLLPVSYIPSARALVHARRTARAASAERLLAIDEPRLLKPSPLPNSHAEVLAISSLFQNPKPEILEHEKASRSAVLQALQKAQVAHFSCHGGANWSDPEKSGLLMTNDEILTIKDLFELHLAGARLATLSACETGVPGTKLPDEVVSLPSAFIRAGFAGAIGSLWTVSDKSTAMLMTSFYRLWRTKGMQPLEALAEAQKELRKEEKFRHPFYWAAFYMTGV